MAGGEVFKLVVDVCPCVSNGPGGQRKRLNLETQHAVSVAVERQRLETGSLCEHQSRY